MLGGWLLEEYLSAFVPCLCVSVCVCVRAHTMIMDSYNKKCGLHVAYNCSRWLEAHTLMHSNDVLWASGVGNVHAPRVGCAVCATPGGVEKEITRGCEREKGRQREGGRERGGRSQVHMKIFNAQYSHKVVSAMVPCINMNLPIKSTWFLTMDINVYLQHTWNIHGSKK